MHLTRRVVVHGSYEFRNVRSKKVIRGEFWPEIYILLRYHSTIMVQSDSKWIFASFANGPLWGPARRRIQSQAKSMGLFSSVVVVDEKWLTKHSSDFRALQDFFEVHPRGFGYWIWKPLLIQTIFELYPECEGILYCDSGCEVNFLGRERLYDYFEIAKKSGMLCFELPFLDIDFTHPTLYREFNFNLDATNRQIMATTFVISNNARSREFLSQWSEIMKLENSKFLLGEDGPLGFPDRELYPNYRAHRHDQSIFSHLVRSFDFATIREESEWYPDWLTNGKFYPIWAARNRLRISVTSNRFLRFLYLCLRKLSSIFTVKKFYF